MTEQLNRTDTMLRSTTIHFKMLAAMNTSFHLAVITLQIKSISEPQKVFMTEIITMA